MDDRPKESEMAGTSAGDVGLREGGQDDGARSILVRWMLSGFHVTAFLTVLTLSLHSGGDLGSSLSALGSLAGNALFLLLAATTTLATWKALGQDPGAWFRARDGRPSGDGAAETSDSVVPRSGGYLGRAAAWGAANGMLFLALAAVGFFVLAYDAGSPSPLSVLTLGLVALVGWLVARARRRRATDGPPAGDDDDADPVSTAKRWPWIALIVSVVVGVMLLTTPTSIALFYVLLPILIAALVGSIIGILLMIIDLAAIRVGRVLAQWIVS